MKRFFTPNFKELTLTAFTLLTLFSACSTRVERDEKAMAKQEPVVATQPNAVTVAAIQAPEDEAYFDLIAETSSCLGENLWIGGKVESSRQMALTKSGDITHIKVYRIKELTATGINSNQSYTFEENAGILKATYAGSDMLHLQLNDGELQLMHSAATGAEPVVLAYHTTKPNELQTGKAGNWSCK